MKRKYNFSIVKKNKKNKPNHIKYKLSCSLSNETCITCIRNIVYFVDMISGNLYNFDSKTNKTLLFDSPKRFSSITQINDKLILNKLDKITVFDIETYYEYNIFDINKHHTIIISSFDNLIIGDCVLKKIFTCDFKSKSLDELQLDFKLDDLFSLSVNNFSNELIIANQFECKIYLFDLDEHTSQFFDAKEQPLSVTNNEYSNTIVYSSLSSVYFYDLTTKSTSKIVFDDRPLSVFCNKQGQVIVLFSKCIQFVSHKKLISYETYMKQF
jgi:hypothetical protein